MTTLLPESDKTKELILLWYKSLAVKKTIPAATNYGNVRSPSSASGNALQAPEKEVADNVYRPVQNYN